MAYIPKEIRELWRVEFETRVNAGRSHGVIQMDSAAAFVLVWGPNHDWSTLEEIIEIAKANPPKAPMLRILSCAPTGVLESHIRNQPVADMTLVQSIAALESNAEASATETETGSNERSAVTPLVSLK